MTTTDLYKKLKAGEITEQKFLYEVRRDPNLPFITNVNNFKDSIQILKNKGIIREEKQEVEIFAKTIDMVNPYDYARGMNYELDVAIDAVGNRVGNLNAGMSMDFDDLTKEDIIKAQKKVLKNLTSNPQYYQQKLIPKMEGESEDVVEVTPKSVEALKKKVGKIIREHGENYDEVSKVMEADIEELGRTRDAIYEKYASKYEVDVNELKDRLEAYKSQKEAITVSDEDTAIKIAKKDPNADVKVMKMGM